MADKKRAPTAIWVDEASGYPLPELLSTRQPYKHEVTQEIRYMNLYEYYGVIQLSYHPEHHDRVMWKAIPDSTALRLLYGNRK